MNKKKLAMFFTFLRIAMTPPIIFLMLMDSLEMKILTSALFILASFTDYFDGYFARKYNAVSNMGKFMDPIADKILVSSVLTMLIFLKKVDPYMVILITARDTFIGGIRSVAAADNVIIAAKSAGKWKTALQMGAIPAVIIGGKWGPLPPIETIGYVILWLSTALSLISGIQYFLAYKEANLEKTNFN